MIRSNYSLLIDAIYIHNGGGKVLLDYLVDNLEKTDLEIYYLFDRRIEDRPYQIKSTNRIEYLDSTFSKRLMFYFRNRTRFGKIFILGNVPPPIKIRGKVFTYFHNTILLNIPKEFGVFETILFHIKLFVIKTLKKNTDVWFTQSEIVSNRLSNSIANSIEVRVMPFYPKIMVENGNVSRKIGRFLYVSNAQANKNHIRLIAAFCKAYDSTGKGELVLTVNNNFPEILLLINEARSKGYPIFNIGFVDREKLATEYSESEFVIFPSLSESFGLGLIEGIEMGCKIIGADLEYTYAVCHPSDVFDPGDVNSICEAIVRSLSLSVKVNSVVKVSDQMNKLIDILR
ncbi:glycosyltransferase [Sphingobacterium spiritivorum]|uniref:glycosyltransferase n=1 Tax=Sphingobacterium spiritivorum TaxID=258 RepID=UPI001918D0C0|nr:glycosyltransferase [Sphingobacterium spiritivorum]QQT27813.1 glycosyltransferase [Sphingobacterium spiritivorum]